MAADLPTNMLSCRRQQRISIDPTPLIDRMDSYELIVVSGLMNSLFILLMLLSTKQVVDIFHPPDSSA
jgi:hypothetical protein